MKQELIQRISKLSILELEELSQHIRSVIQREKREEVLRTIRSLADEAGIDLDDLVSVHRATATGSDGNSASQGKNQRLYVHPQDPNLTWSGRGRHPYWFKDLIRSGVSPDSLLTEKHASDD